MLILLTILAMVSGEVRRCVLPPFSGEESRRLAVPSIAAGRQSGAGGLVHVHQTQHFALHWMTQSSDESIVGEPGINLPADSVPEMVRVSAKALEMAWTVYVDSLGYLPPKGASRTRLWDLAVPEGKYPVEFGNVCTMLGGSGKPGDKCYGGVQRQGAFGSRSYMALAADLATFEVPPVIKDADGQKLTFNYSEGWREPLRATCVHELFHAVQFNYETNVGAHGFFEASAVAMETRFVPESHDYLQYAGDLANLATMTPFPTGIVGQAYPQGFQVRSMMNDLGIGVVKALWESRKDNPPNPPSFLSTLRQVLPLFRGSFDTQLVRHAVRLALTGRRSGWSLPELALFPDASSFPVLLRSLYRSSIPTELRMELGGVQVLIDTVAPAGDRLFVWIPDPGVGMGHIKTFATGASVSWETGSVRYSAADAARSVWAFANPGNPSALRALATSDASVSHYSMVAAPARTAAHADQNLTWTSPEDLVLTGRSRSESMATPLLHLDIWKPSAAKDPFAASVVANDGHAIVLEDADHRLALSGAKIRLDGFFPGAAYIGSGDGKWLPVAISGSDEGVTLDLGELDLSSPVRILVGGVSAGAALAARVLVPRPNPSRGGESVRFPIAGATGSQWLDIIATDGGLVREIRSQAGQTEVVWDLRNRENHLVRPGVYWYVWRGATGAKRGRLLVAD